MNVVVPFKRSRPESCVSDFLLDRMLATELDKEEERAVRKHLFGCVECTARMETLRKGRDEFLSVAGPHLSLVKKSAEILPLPIAAATGDRKKWIAPMAALAAGLAAVGLYTLMPVIGGIDPGFRTKGNSKLGFYVKHETEVRRGADGEVVEPGDTLRFTYSLAEPKHLAIISVDAAKKASVYYPEGQVTDSVPAGRDLALPLAALLDGTLGRENIYGLFCEDRVSVESVRRAFEAGAVEAPNGCELERMTIEKR